MDYCRIFFVSGRAPPKRWEGVRIHKCQAIKKVLSFAKSSTHPTPALRRSFGFLPGFALKELRTGHVAFCKAFVLYGDAHWMGFDSLLVFFFLHKITTKLC